jgi:micrococcal nuclease
VTPRRIAGVVAAAWLIAAPIRVASQQAISGRVVAVHDGDTITVRTSSTTFIVRIADVDSPEIGQPYSARARDFTSQLVFGRDVQIETRGLDQYNRTIGRVTVDGTDLGDALVHAGLAWVYSRGVPNHSLAESERDARSRHAGLWADPSPVPPWSWRRSHQPDGTSRSTAPSGSRPESIPRVDLRDARGPFHGNTQSRVFHRPECPHYNCKHCDEAFLTVESAMEAGYKPAGDCFRKYESQP